MEISVIRKWIDGDEIGVYDFNKPARKFKAFIKYSYEGRMIILSLLTNIDELEKDNAKLKSMIENGLGFEDLVDDH